MPRPTTRPALLAASREAYGALLDLVDAFPPAEQQADFPPGTLNRCMRDVLAHLHHWHLLMLGWYEAGMAGQTPAMPAPGYTWRQTADLNHEIWETYRSVDLEEVKARLAQSHDAVHALIEGHTDEELFEKKRYPWTGSTSLGAYLISSTSSHYAWATTLIRRAKRQPAVPPAT